MILIIDDDSAVRSSLSFMLKRAGYEAQVVPGPREAIEVVRTVAPDLILMDMNFTLSTTGEEGLTLLKQVKVFRPDTPVILMTAWGSIQLAVQGMQAGAFDFIPKPWNNAALLQRIETALELSTAPKETTQEQNDAFNRNHIIGRSQGLTDVLNTIARIAKTNASVLITGESGTGKELIAEAIHINSQRAKHPFVKVNLGGISQSLFESEMFGHKKGAFTDASADRIGRFEMANKGTIFLDEIGDMPSSMQAKLLRVLQERCFERLGGTESLSVDVRIITATNRDLARLAAARHNVGHARALEHAEVNVGPHILRHYVGAGAATLDLRGRAGGRHQRIELLAGEALAHDGVLVGGNLVGRVKPQLDELCGKQVRDARRPFDIADCGDGTAEHLERSATVGVGRMPALTLRLEHNIGVALLREVGMHKPALARAVLGSWNDAVVTLVDQVLKLNAALLERAADGACAVLRSLLVLAKGQEQRALVLPTVRQRILNRLENACDLVFHIDGAATPNVGVVYMPAKGGVRPIVLGAGHHGNHVHVAHEHNGLEGRVGTAKRHQ